MNINDIINEALQEDISGTYTQNELNALQSKLERDDVFVYSYHDSKLDLTIQLFLVVDSYRKTQGSYSRNSSSDLDYRGYSDLETSVVYYAHPLDEMENNWRVRPYTKRFEENSDVENEGSNITTFLEKEIDTRE